MKQNIPSLFRVMGCRLLGDNPLSKPMVLYCQLDSKEHIAMKFHFIFRSFHSRKCKGACRLQKIPSCLDLSVLETTSMLHFFHIELPFAEGIILLNHGPESYQICKVLLHHLIGKTQHELIFQQWEFLN